MEWYVPPSAHREKKSLVIVVGTGIQLYGKAISASYSIALDGRPFEPSSPADNVLATITDLPDTLHTLVLTALIPGVQDPPNSSIVMFHSAVITSCPEPLKYVEINYLRMSLNFDLSATSLH